MKKLSQPSRLIIWILYIFALLGLSCYLYNSPIPPTSEQGLWFYSCLASIVLGELITSPYFTSPADVRVPMKSHSLTGLCRTVRTGKILVKVL